MRHPRFRGQQSLNRKPPKRTPKPKILIVCEGRETEPNYFNAIRKSKRLSPRQIVIIRGDEAGIQPANIVKYAQKRNRHEERTGSPYDYVWCVFDKDEHSNLSEAFLKLKKLNFKVAFSNPSFELWYLLHFSDHTASIHRDEVLRKLKTKIPGYTKSMDVFPIIINDQKQAVKRAKKLIEYHRQNGEPENKNPSTDVFKLVEQLNKIN